MEKKPIRVQLSLHVIYSPILVDVENNKVVGIWSATSRSTFFFGIQKYLMMEDTVPSFIDTVADDYVNLVVGTWHKSLRCHVKISTNDHSYKDDKQCFCHKKLSAAVCLT